MSPRCRIFVAFVVFFASLCRADSGQTSATHLSKQNRLDLISSLNSELVYIRTPFPMDKRGLTLKDGVITPNGEELRILLAGRGPSVKPGDRARISMVQIKSDRIHFEINGGPMKKEKWYQHVSVGLGGADTPIANAPQENPRGSALDLVFDHYVPDLTTRQLKALLYPVFDFDSKSPLQAYLETVPPNVKKAIQNHQVLVGMDREMVIYSKGRAAQKTREKDGDVDYEEWIYGQPPEDVDFVRLVGDEVVRVETMKVTGERVIRTAKEVNLGNSTAADSPAAGASSGKAPTLRRPGEEPADAPERSTPSNLPPIDTTGTPPSQPNINFMSKL